MIISDKCVRGLHGFCTATRDTCGCTSCHKGPCTECGRNNLIKMYVHDQFCADCYRKICQAQPHTTTLCQRCGKGGAFRNPATRRNEFFCLECHIDLGETLSLAGGTQTLLADCASADVSDPRHVWVHVKSARFVCERCQTRKWDPRARDIARRRMLDPEADDDYELLIRGTQHDDLLHND